MFTGFTTPGTSYGSFCGHWQVNAADLLPPLETLTTLTNNQLADAKNGDATNEYAFLIKPESLCFCNICGLCFEDNSSFNDHCQQCYRSLISANYPSNHYNNGHLLDVPPHVRGDEYISDIPMNVDSSSNDNSNNDLQPSNDISTCNEDGNNANEPKKIKTERKNKWHCEHCQMTFQYKKDKIKHEYVHTGDKPFACMYCGKKWKNKTALKRHVHTHTGEKPYECNWCEKRYTQSTLLKNHCQKTHGMLVKFKKGKAIQTGTVDVKEGNENNLDIREKDG